MCPSKLRYWAAAVRTNYGHSQEVKPGHVSFTLRYPIGVAGVIAPFNSPVVLTIRSLAPALAAGTTAVFYRVATARLTTGTDIEVVGEKSGGEVEFVLLQYDGRLWVGAG